MGGGGLLFFTFADYKYHVFAALYPIFAITSNPDSCVEICISQSEIFSRNYSNIIDFYNTNYPGRVLYRGLKVSGVLPNSVRFLIQPKMTAKYVYIGDIDILLLDENIADYHISFMKKHDSDFSNVLRNEKRLTGLHFMEYEKIYPVKIPKGVDLSSTNDEVLLCMMMREKNMRFPAIGTPSSERKIHGLHISFFNRLPLSTLTTRDRIVRRPSWTLESGAERYFDVRYSEPVVKFMECIDEGQRELRRVIQFADMFAYYKLNENSGRRQ